MGHYWQCIRRTVRAARCSRVDGCISLTTSRGLAVVASSRCYLTGGLVGVSLGGAFEVGYGGPSSTFGRAADSNVEKAAESRSRPPHPARPRLMHLLTALCAAARAHRMSAHHSVCSPLRLRPRAEARAQAADASARPAVPARAAAAPRSPGSLLLMRATCTPLGSAHALLAHELGAALLGSVSARSPCHRSAQRARLVTARPGRAP